MTTSTDFETQLDDNPADWTLRAIYADWLEEQGNPRAESQRWMVANERHPFHVPKNGWDWWNVDYVSEDDPSDVSAEIMAELTGDPPDGYSPWNVRNYPTKIAAEIDLHNALVKTGEITCALIEEVEA